MPVILTPATVNMTCCTLCFDLQVFDAETGLYKFPCLSEHSAVPDGDPHLAECIQERDQYTDSNPICTPREDGCLNGPDLFAPIPESTCPCKVCALAHIT